MTEHRTALAALLAATMVTISNSRLAAAAGGEDAAESEPAEGGLAGGGSGGGRGGREGGHSRGRPDGPTATVTLENRGDPGRAIRLYIITGTAYATSGYVTAIGMSFEEICTAPCTETVPADRPYFVGGDDVAGSKPFRIPRDARDVTIGATAGIRGTRGGGIGLICAGSVLAVAGVITTTLAIVFSSPSSGVRTGPFFGTGIPLLVVGGGAVIAGALVLPLGRTRVAVEVD